MSQPHPARDLHVREIGFAHDAHAAAFGNEVEVDRLEVHQQRVGPHVVGTPRFAVELRRVVGRGREERPVQDHVAADLAQPARAQLADELPKALVGELGVAAAAQDEVARERASRYLAGHEDVGLEGVGRTEEVEPGEGGDELDHGSGVERPVGLVRDQARASGHPFHDRAHGGLGHARPGERIAHGAGKLGGRESGHEEHGGQERPHACPSSSAIAVAARTRIAKASSSAT